MPPGIRTVVDLTSEFVKPIEVREGRSYICAPIDASVPRFAALQTLMEAVYRSSGPIYIHCATGYGRSAMVVIATILARGIVPTLTEAERLVKQARPGVNINSRQRRLLERWSSGMTQARQP